MFSEADFDINPNFNTFAREALPTMSGVEVIAIVTLVAGLIEALDAGARIVRQIKERRRNHRADGALPPSDDLEKTIEDGKNDIQKLVEKGEKRFGSEWVADGNSCGPTWIACLTNTLQNPPR